MLRPTGVDEELLRLDFDVMDLRKKRLDAEKKLSIAKRSKAWQSIAKQRVPNHSNTWKSSAKQSMALQSNAPIAKQCVAKHS